jgi:hypothetical protein
MFLLHWLLVYVVGAEMIGQFLVCCFLGLGERLGNCVDYPLPVQTNSRLYRQ